MSSFIATGAEIARSVRDAALGYRARGWSPIAIPYGKKGARDKKWPDQRLTDADIRRKFSRKKNVGILLGPSERRFDRR
jgi:hypothetical protein